MQPKYFSVSTRKFIVMTVFTFGLYLYYWLYRQFCHERATILPGSRPAWRTVFFVFYCYGLFKRIGAAFANELPGKPLAAGALAAGFIVCSVLACLDDSTTFFVYISLFFAVPVQSRINKGNDAIAPDRDRNEDYSGWNLAAIAAGVLVYVFAFAVVAGALQPVLSPLAGG